MAEAEEPRDDMSESSEDEADVFDNYGVFQSDYEFKFVQEGNDKTTLMLPPVTYDSMEVKYFNIEIEVDSELHVSALEKEETVNGTTRFFFRIAKQGLQVVEADEVEAFEKLGEDGYEYEEIKDYAAEKAERAKKRKPKKPRTAMDAHNYSKPKVVMTSAPTVKVEDEGEKYEEIEKAQGVALDGTQLDKDTNSFLEQCDDGEEEIEDEGEDMDDDGDDDMDDFDEIEIGENLTLPGEEGDDDDEDDLMKTPKRKGKGIKGETTSEKKRRKYDKTNFYSKNSSNFTVEMTDEGKTMFKCNFCEYISISRSAGNIRDHERKHTGERPFVCDVCGEGFTRVENLKSHQTMHSYLKPFICPTCGMRFKSRKRLSGHEQQVHVKKYRCQICAKPFGSTGQLARHMPVHTGEKNFECQICNKMFAQDSGMKRHMQCHTGGQFQCHICARRFIRKEYFRDHMVKEHNYKGNEDFLIQRKFKKETSVLQ
ncbi:zinc finger and SCAN domain-containing protein 31-like isoform X4 [Mercenaria mercenaria]|uniref:zinc finger and SCAN domain-containing protein 31-like isoform X4 n=1 Tax=Mercenaria mercenaria TaxID=6596 RepID=UPI00234F7EBC|nr:zinc finger and SCAN domain-containing protein 31-like isoform X4 [Mercenaria mercenaria]